MPRRPNPTRAESDLAGWEFGTFIPLLLIRAIPLVFRPILMVISSKPRQMALGSLRFEYTPKNMIRRGLPPQFMDFKKSTKKKLESHSYATLRCPGLTYGRHLIAVQQEAGIEIEEEEFMKESPTAGHREDIASSSHSIQFSTVF